MRGSVERSGKAVEGGEYRSAMTRSLCNLLSISPRPEQLDRKMGVTNDYRTHRAQHFNQRRLGKGCARRAVK